MAGWPRSAQKTADWPPIVDIGGSTVTVMSMGMRPSDQRLRWRGPLPLVVMPPTLYTACSRILDLSPLFHYFLPMCVLFIVGRVGKRHNLSEVLARRRGHICPELPKVAN